MQAYGPSFAKAYSEHWGQFATGMAPRVLEWLVRSGAIERISVNDDGRPHVIDLCCGTGQLANALADSGVGVYGIDLSEHMLEQARETCAENIGEGRVTLGREDATEFTVPSLSDAVVSLFDSLNHMADIGELKRCFERSAAAVRPGGAIGFDLNTAHGLRSRWRSITVEERDDLVVISRGMYIESERRGYLSVSGFRRAEGELYERFEENVFNVAFTMEEVAAALEESGWERVRFLRFPLLDEPVAEPEQENRVFVEAIRSSH